MTAVLLLSFSWIGWLIVADASGHNLAVDNPKAALEWNSKEAVALVQTAERQIVNPAALRAAARAADRTSPARRRQDLVAARALIQRSLLTRPLDSHALALLALAGFEQRDTTKAHALLTIAGRLSWRDLLAQSLLLNEAVAQHRYAAALAHADALVRLRQDINLRLRVFAVLDGFSRTPDSWNALARFLAVNDPPWRFAFLKQLSTSMRDRTELEQLYDDLSRGKSPPTAPELKLLLDRLIADGAYAQAHRRWLATLAKDRKPGPIGPYNGNFAHPPDGQPFDWTLDSITGAEIRIVDAPEAEGKALGIEFSGARVDFQGKVRQLLTLPPGSYRLSGQVRTKDLQTRRGLWWRVYCAQNANENLGHTDLIAGSKPWSGFSADFVVPDSGCSAQWLALDLAARIAPERAIEGQAWFKNIDIRSVENVGR